jgi:hypothetical protein
MKRNSELLPTLIVDVNGKTTTVHKKPAASRSTSTLPAPSSLAARQNLIASVTNFLEDALPISEDNAQYQQMLTYARNTIHSYSNGLLEKIIASSSHDERSRKAIARMIRMRTKPDVIEECIAFFPQIPMHPSTSEAAIRALRFYPQLTACDNFAKADEQTQKQCVALVTVTSIMDTDFEIIHPDALEWHEYSDDANMYPVIKDQRIVNLLMERPEAAQRIADFIKERHTSDFDLIEAMLQGAHSAFDEGAL